MNHTQNYQLSQWEKTDKVLMDDFNEDNAKLDAALTNKIGRSEVIQVIDAPEHVNFVTFDTRTLDWSEWETVTFLISPANAYDPGTISCTLTNPYLRGHSVGGDGILKQGEIEGGIRLIFLPCHNPQGQVQAVFLGGSCGCSWGECTFAELGNINFNYHGPNGEAIVPLGTKLTVIGRR